MSRKVFRRGVTDTSTTLSDLGEIGDKRFEDGKTYRLVYAATTQIAKAILALDSTDASLASYTVQAVPASNATVYGVNDTGGTLASGTYFWCMAEGPYVVNSTILGSDVDIATEEPLGLNSDKRLATIVTATSDHLTQACGFALIAITSTASTQGTPTVLIKGLGA